MVEIKHSLQGDYDMGTLGPLELGIILVIVVLLFGVGRISKLGSELGKGVSSFRKGLKDGAEDVEDAVEDAA